ncbi:hypothetical protein DC28_12445 [Spirochaeta lutea]|uniref:Uncharacterized protein n=1 Tax=Spirochaeta lutea TaxID=1480694 RepID=A0A098QTP4_9SPIO|nr:hypothetical protein DC28_12445 [Spirochaeta lutea]
MCPRPRSFPSPNLPSPYPPRTARRPSNRRPEQDHRTALQSGDRYPYQTALLSQNRYPYQGPLPTPGPIVFGGRYAVFLV